MSIRRLAWCSLTDLSSFSVAGRVKNCTTRHSVTTSMVVRNFSKEKFGSVASVTRRALRQTGQNAVARLCSGVLMATSAVLEERTEHVSCAEKIDFLQVTIRQRSGF